LDNMGMCWTAVDNRGFSPAVYAAGHGRLGVVQWLNIKGALLEVPRVGWGTGRPDPWGDLRRILVSDEAPIVIAAAAGGHNDVLEFLVEEVGVPFEADREVGVVSRSVSRRARERGSLGALHVASRGGHGETVGSLMRLGSPTGALAARCEHVVRFPLREGEAARRPFFGVASREVELRLTPLGEAVLSGSVECVRMLLSLQCEVDGSSPSAVTLAVLYGFADIVGVLLEREAGAVTEAYSVCVALGNEWLAGFVERTDEGCEFVWCDGVVVGLRLREWEVVERFCGERPMTREAAGSRFWERRGLWVGLRGMLLNGTSTREVVEEVLGARAWESFGFWDASEVVMAALRGSGARASKILPENGEELEVDDLRALRRIFGEDPRCDVDLWSDLPSTAQLSPSRYREHRRLVVRVTEDGGVEISAEDWEPEWETEEGWEIETDEVYEVNEEEDGGRGELSEESDWW
jgi:hypothetical protein